MNSLIYPLVDMLKCSILSYSDRWRRCYTVMCILIYFMLMNGICCLKHNLLNLLSLIPTFDFFGIKFDVLLLLFCNDQLLLRICQKPISIMRHCISEQNNENFNLEWEN